MNTKGVEDGMSDEQACINCFKREGEHSVEDQCIDDRGHLLGTEWEPIRPATPEELTAQAENRGKNYKPGDRWWRGEEPFPAAVPVEERTEMWTCDTCMTCNPKHCKCAPVPEERTAEMEELMGRLRELNGRGVLLDSSEVKILLDHIEGKAMKTKVVSAEQDFFDRRALMDELEEHLKPQPAESQEVQE